MKTLKFNRKSIAAIVTGVTLMGAGAFAVATPGNPFSAELPTATTGNVAADQDLPTEPETPATTEPIAEPTSGETQTPPSTTTTPIGGQPSTGGGTSEPAEEAPTPPPAPAPRVRVSEQLIYTNNGAGREIATCHIVYSDGTFEDIYRGARPAGDTSIQLEC